MYCLSQLYDTRLLILALIVCVVASLATFNLYPRAIAEADTPNAPLWIALTIVTAGSAIWTTHFTAMLAFEPGLRLGFEIAAADQLRRRSPAG